MRWYASCTYDASGNLFIEAETNKFQFLLLELPKGGNKLVPLTLHTKAILDFPIQWDGSYITIANLSIDTAVLTIYRISVSGAKATIVGKTELKGAGHAVWIEGSTAISARCCKDNQASNVGFYDYPAGGTPRLIYRGLENMNGRSRRQVLGLVVATLPSESGPRK